MVSKIIFFVFTKYIERFQRSFGQERILNFCNLLPVSYTILSIAFSFRFYIVVRRCNYHSQIKHASHINIYVFSGHQEVYII